MARECDEGCQSTLFDFCARKCCQLEVRARVEAVNVTPKIWIARV